MPDGSLCEHVVNAFEVQRRVIQTSSFCRRPCFPEWIHLDAFVWNFQYRLDIPLHCCIPVKVGGRNFIADISNFWPLGVPGAQRHRLTKNLADCDSGKCTPSAVLPPCKFEWKREGEMTHVIRDASIHLYLETCQNIPFTTLMKILKIHFQIHPHHYSGIAII